MDEVVKLLRGGQCEDFTRDRPPDDLLQRAADDEAVRQGRVEVAPSTDEWTAGPMPSSGSGDDPRGPTTTTPTGAQVDEEDDRAAVAKRFRYLAKSSKRAREAEGSEQLRCQREGCVRPRGHDGDHENEDGKMANVEAVQLDVSDRADEAIETPEEEAAAPDADGADRDLCMDESIAQGMPQEHPAGEVVQEEVGQPAQPPLAKHPRLDATAALYLTEIEKELQRVEDDLKFQEERGAIFASWWLEDENHQVLEIDLGQVEIDKFTKKGEIYATRKLQGNPEVRWKLLRLLDAFEAWL